MITSGQRANLGCPAATARRPFALAQRGFRWRPHAGVWARDGVALSEEQLATMPEATWQAFLAHLDDPGCPTCGRAWAGRA
jgi:hypothetical protein